MNIDTKTWLNIYLEHTRHYAHEPELSLEVVAHLWHVAWGEGWSVLVEYLRQHIDVKTLRDIDQWALNMCLLPHALEAHARWYKAFKAGSENFTKAQVRFVAERIDLSWANFSGADLGKANFKDAYLVGANFSFADLTSARINYACLAGASFYSADLTDADLFKADFDEADFTDADIAGINFFASNLREANLSGVNLSNTCFINTNFNTVKYNSQTKWPDNFDPTDPTHGLILIED